MRGTLRKNSSVSQALHRLQRPLPVMYSFLPNFSFLSIIVTAAPARAANSAAESPAAPPPMTTTCLFSFIHIDAVCVPHLFQLLEAGVERLAVLNAQRHNQRVDHAHGRGHRIHKGGHVCAHGQADVRHLVQRAHGAVRQADYLCMARTSKAHGLDGAAGIAREADAQQHIAGLDARNSLKHIRASGGYHAHIVKIGVALAGLTAQGQGNLAAFRRGKEDKHILEFM